jgi:predicted metal-dependent hydrolase
MQKRTSIESDKFYLLGKLCKKDDFQINSDKELDIFYKKVTIETISPLIETWSKTMQLFPTQVGYRKTKTRWGSCSHKNSLSFSTNLAKMNLEFIEYVVVHELAHIKHKNHSKAFWGEVAKYLPDYKRRKKLIV